MKRQPAGSGTLRLLLIQTRINKDPATILTNYHFLPGTDVQLALGRDIRKTPPARIPLHGDHSQAIAGIPANSSEGLQKTGINFFLNFGSFLLQHLHFLAGIGSNLIQLPALVLQVSLSLFEQGK